MLMNEINFTSIKRGFVIGYAGFFYNVSLMLQYSSKEIVVYFEKSVYCVLFQIGREQANTHLIVLM